MPFELKMLAYCGLYCEQCSFKAAHDEQTVKHLENIPYAFPRRGLSVYNCECCKGFCICGPCKIKPCAEGKNITSCAECNDFPCEHIRAFAQDGMPHHAKAVENLHEIRAHGIVAWFAKIKPSLKCGCGKKQIWYYICPLHKP